MEHFAFVYIIGFFAKSDVFPLLRINDLLNQLGKSKYTLRWILCQDTGRSEHMLTVKKPHLLHTGMYLNSE